MIKTLRKRHLQIWIVLAVVIPPGIVTAWLCVPQEAKDKLLQPASAQALPIVLSSAEKDGYTVRIRSNNDTSQLQLEWINKKTLTYPTATIYWTTIDVNNIDNALFLGRIEARGNYYFPFGFDKSQIQQFNKKYDRIIIYDFIHKQIIDSITF